MNTPWGVYDSVRETAPGIRWYGTSSHGGFWLSPERVAEMPAALRGFRPWAGDGWFEEDCDWALVPLSFPSLFTADEVFHAVQAVTSNGQYFAERGADLAGYWVTVQGVNAKAVAKQLADEVAS